MEKVFQAADIMLPTDEVNMSKWAVVACDQFTSEKDYWEEAAAYVGSAPSTLAMILPEAFLDQPDREDRMDRIHQTMADYEKEGILRTLGQTMIYIEREDSGGKIRQGLIGCLDLECYDYTRGSCSPVRATEATVPARLPARVKIRENAPLELPHIMVLIDDDRKTVIEPLAHEKDRMKCLYDFDLMLGGGRLKGYQLDTEEIDRVTRSLGKLGDQKAFEERYQVEGHSPLLYAVGDGNHSLAAAKLFYENLKKEHPDRDFSDHPARYALVELVNLHSPALEFKAIHRIVKDVDVEALLAHMTDQLELTELKDGEDNSQENDGMDQDIQSFILVRRGKRRTYRIGRQLSKLTVGSLQKFLDSWCQSHGGEIDYIHGGDAVDNLSLEERTVGFLLPRMKKSELFPTVIFDGALPRKTFSMGYAQDKRYYVECRRIVED